MANVRSWVVLGLVLLGAALAQAEEGAGAGGDTIAWQKDLSKAFAQAKAGGKVLMICVNARRVTGRSTEEPAAKGLREVIYLDPRVVERSREFVCAFLTPQGSSADYGELRALGIEGAIVSPQHIFVAPAGDRVVLRQKYWSSGWRESGIQALLDMMAKALAKNGTGPEPEAQAPELPGAPDGADGADETKRAVWIARLMRIVWEGAEAGRRAALGSLVENDKEGDCIDPLIAMMPKLAGESDDKEKPYFPILSDVIRAIGIDGLERAAGPIAGHLRHEEALVRANAAVSLEHIGSKDKAAVKELRSRLVREKDVFVARHMARALGRCAAGDAKTHKVLVKIASKMDDRDWSFGALIGLAYFEGDARAARSIEKIIQKLGPPQGRRGGQGFLYYTQRALSVWALAHIKDKKSAAYVQKTLVDPAAKSNWEWKDRILDFYGAVVDTCQGDKSEEVKTKLNDGLRYYFGRLREEAPWKDEARKGREHSGFEPKADWVIEGQG